MFKKITFLVILLSISLFSETVEVERDSFFFTKKVTSTTSEPSTLQYYDFSENLADEVVLDIFKGRNLSNLKGKKIFVGYGVVDPTGSDCKVFPPEITGAENNITVCLPWWRIERSYKTENIDRNSDFKSFLSRMQRPRPPKNVNVCNGWKPSQKLPGGTVTCTTYYDRTLNASCFANPKQAQCYKNNCGSWVIENCKRSGRSIGYKKEELRNVEITEHNEEQRYISKVNLVTEQFVCPGGSFTKYANCIDEEIVTMHPFECKEDNPETPLDDSIMKYCDENKPVRDVATGKITGFLGTCPREASANNLPFTVTCEVDSFTQTRNECTKYDEDTVILKNEIIDESYELNFKEQRISVLTGALDRFSANESCIRMNSVEDSREELVYMIAAGDGKLDDDLYLTVHSSDNTHNVVYCNQQHNENAGSRLNLPEFGGVIQCIDNDGTYSFKKRVNIKVEDIVSIQQSTENENDRSIDSFSLRAGYVSSKVLIDGIETTPEVYRSNFPYHAGSGNALNIWENTLGSLTLLFPYSGSYTLYFFTDSGELIVKKEINGDDFNALGDVGYKQLFLAKDMEIAPTLDASNEETLCLDDDWVDYGGGVQNGKNSKYGTPCQRPSAGNSYQKSKAIKRVAVRDNLTGSITIVPLVYPLGYPNRVFVSKLKLYEDRVYNCYEEPAIKAPF